MSVFTSLMGLRPHHVTELHVTISNPLFGASVVSTFLGAVSAMMLQPSSVEICCVWILKFYISVQITVSWF